MAIHSMAKIDNMAPADAWTAGDVVSERHSRRRLTGSRMSAHCRGLRYNGGVGRWSYIAGNVVLVAMKPAAPSTHRRWFTNCPASTIFAGWRQSVLPVHLLGLAPLLGSVGPVAGDVKLQDDGVVHDPVNRRGGGHGVGEDAFPLREDQV